MILVYKLPYEISLQIILFLGWYQHPCLKQDLLHCIRLLEIFTSLYDHNKTQMRQYLKSRNIISAFAKLSRLQRVCLIYNAPKNYLISYVQEYPSFMLYEMETLRNI